MIELVDGEPGTEEALEIFHELVGPSGPAHESIDWVAYPSASARQYATQVLEGSGDARQVGALLAEVKRARDEAAE